MAKKRKQVRTIVTDIFGRTSLETPINSKKKGEKNERACAKFMEKITGKKFTRVPASGGMRWINTANAVGDLVCEDADYQFPFSIETKHLKSIPVTTKLRSNSVIYTIYRQCKDDADRSDRHPMLILRSNGMATGSYTVFFEEDVYKVITEISEIFPIAVGHGKDFTLYGYRSEDMINNLDFQIVVEKFLS